LLSSIRVKSFYGSLMAFCKEKMPSKSFGQFCD